MHQGNEGLWMLDESGVRNGLVVTSGLFKPVGANMHVLVNWMIAGCL